MATVRNSIAVLNTDCDLQIRKNGSGEVNIITIELLMTP